MDTVITEKESFFSRIKREASVLEICYWWIVRGLLLFSSFTADSSGKKILLLSLIVLTFTADALHIIFPRLNLSARFQSYASFIALSFGVAGVGFGLLEKYPDSDLLLEFASGLCTAALGYYLARALREPKNKKEYTFTAFFSLCFAGTVIIFKKLGEFFTDFYTGSNLCHTEFVEDSHWLYRLLGFGMSPYEQRPLLDTDEDFIFAFLGAVLSTATIYLYQKIKNKEAFRGEKTDIRDLFRNFSVRCKKKISLEIEKLRNDTDVFDWLFWWCTRGSMAYAFIIMENRAEANLLLANFVATFAVTLVHLVFPQKSVFCKVSYRVQTLITTIVFLGSYAGNFVFVYNIVPRFDLFLHFISGFLCVAGGYYIALTLVDLKTKKDSMLISLFSLFFSCFIMPAWEVSEFVGDFIWGTSNQGFYWGPTDESFFFKVFGGGVGNTRLYYLFDTVYDVLLAIVTTVISFILLYVFLELSRKRKEKGAKAPGEAKQEKRKVAC